MFVDNMAALVNQLKRLELAAYRYILSEHNDRHRQASYRRLRQLQAELEVDETYEAGTSHP